MTTGSTGVVGVGDAGRFRQRLEFGGTLLAFLIVAMLVNSIGIIIMESVRHFGVSRATAAHLVTTQMSCALVAALFAAARVPHFGHRRALIITMSVLVATTLAMAVAQNFRTMQCGAAISGFAFVIVKVVVYDTIGSMTHHSSRPASMIALAEAVFAGGIVAGFLLFAGFAETDWRNAYFVLAGLSMVATGLVVATRPDRAVATVEPEQSATSPMPHVVTKPMVLVMLLAVFAYVLVEQGVTAWLPTFNREMLHLPPTRAILMAGLFSACMAIGRASAAIALRWISSARVLAGTSGAIIALLAVATAAPSFGLALDVAVILPLTGLLLAPLFPILNAAVVVRLPRRDHAALVGLSIVVATLGGAIGAVATGILLEAGDGVGSFLSLLLALGIVLAVAFGLLRWPVQLQERP